MTLELASNREAALTSRADSPLAVRGMTVSYGQKPADFFSRYDRRAGKDDRNHRPEWRRQIDLA